MTTQSQSDQPVSPPAASGDYTNMEMFQYFLFWSWNLIFLAFMSLGFAPTLLPETFTAVRLGLIPVEFLLYALILAVIPVICVVLGLTVLRRSPRRLFALGYVVEGPLMLLLALRFFAIRQATPGVTLLICIALLGMGAFLWDIFSPQGKRLRWLRLMGLTLMALVAIYAAVWIAFYAIPLAGMALRWLGDVIANIPQWFRDIGYTITQMLREAPAMIAFSFLGFILAIYTATLFVLTPIAVPYLSIRAWWRVFNSYKERNGWAPPALLVTGVVVACIGLFVWANRQPQRAAFTLLKRPPTSQGEAQELLKRSESIRRGLLNSYLAPFRYISSRGEVVHIRTLYEDTFHIPIQQAFAVQDMFESVSRPLLYEPVHPARVTVGSEHRALVQEPDEAARLYQQFFDTPIVEAERETIVDAVRSTWSMDQAESAWQAVDEREVYLVQQEINSVPHGDWAEFELHEVYQNQTGQNQEVVYYFNLPESAVVTGVWLGNSPDKELAYVYQVAPRGAAQAVYREQTRVQKDPALVEQIGPRQYRLRAFPVPPLLTEYNETTRRTEVNEAPELHLWLAWQVMAQDGAWPLPRLAEKRNVFWDADTERLVNGSPADSPDDEWMPESLPANDAEPTAHRVDLATGQTVLALPVSQVTLPALPEPLRLALVLDRSRSMEDYRDDVVLALERLKAVAGQQGADVYLTASPYRGEEPAVTTLDELDPAALVFFGGQNAAELISQYDELHGDQSYDAIVVLTDGSGYELGESPVEAPTPDAPVWLVHLGGGIPLGYDDGTLEAIQASGGGVAGDVDTALTRLGVSISQGSDAAVTDLVDGYLWVTLPVEAADAAIPSGAQATVHSSGDPFAAFAARRVILAEMQRNRGSLDQLGTLDQLHALAQEYSIVTPYSSMIVLVNEQQQALLEAITSGSGRYEREVEAVGETRPASPVPLTGVPEPHEWLLLGLAAAFLIYLGYTKRSEFARARIS